jgi:hypothetical protein
MIGNGLRTTFNLFHSECNGYNVCQFSPSCANIVPMTKHLFRAAIKTVAGIAAVVFLLARMTTSTGLLWFVGSIIGLLVCFVSLKLLEDDDENTGYWPPNPKT